MAVSKTPGSGSDTPEVHFFNLDIVRFVAVSMVIIYHGYGAYTGWFHNPVFMTDKEGQLSAFGNRLECFFLNQQLGVDLFFLISGFLITYLLLKEKEYNGKIATGKFYVRRILRIWPLYYLVIALTPFIVKLAHSAIPHFTGTIFFFNNYEAIARGTQEFPFIHFWTLSVEEQFYLAWPLLLTIIPKRILPWFFTGIVLSAIIFRWYAYYGLPDGFYNINLNSLTRGDTIVIGSLLAYFHHRRSFRFRFSWFTRGVIYFVFFAGFFTFATYAPASLFAFIFLKYFFLAGFIFWMMNYLFNPGAVFNFKRKNVLHYLGRISYGIYIFHNILIPVIISKFFNQLAGGTTYLFWLIYPAATLLLAIVSYELIEKRMLRFKERFSIIRSAR